MSLCNFRSYHQATALYRGCQTLPLPAYVKDQLMRAALSIATNLGEGSGKSSPKDRGRFYQIALGSLREVQVILDLHGTPALVAQANTVGAHVYKLVKALEHPG